MLVAAIAFFGVALVLGLTNLMYVVMNRKPPMIVVLLHGAFALTGILVLAIYLLTFGNMQGALVTVLVLFILAGLGGLTMLYKHFTQKHIPKWMAAGHGTLAFCTFLFFVIYLASQ